MGQKTDIQHGVEDSELCSKFDEGKLSQFSLTS
jgi:hypothetical protein